MNQAGKQRTYVVGTAGHVDHGKSTLVQALTGIDPDRLQEEKERALTIDLGFAWLELPTGESVSIVDVPGHERFIKNMLAGVGGIDAAILVIAADEGPMPQTREHLAILDLLEISCGVVAVTKRDLVDEEWLELVIEEIREQISSTVLENAPIVPVAALTGDGLDEFVETLSGVLPGATDRASRGRPRLPVDRVFSVSGFGTVVTGTLLGDELAVGQELEILPGGLRGRVRGLQTHGEPVDVARPGSRTAINISGVDRENVVRGDLITVPGWIRPTTMLDAYVRIIPDSPRALEQNDPVDFFVGASERAARVTLLNDERIEPGQSGWVQLRFDQPVAVVEQDLFIIRQPSPSVTIGGGRVVDAHPRRHRRFRPEVISELEVRATGSPLQRLEQMLRDGPKTVRELLATLEIGREDLNELVAQAPPGRIVSLGADEGERMAPGWTVALDEYVEDVGAQATTLVRHYHERNPLRRGMPREEVRRRLDLDARLFDMLMATLAERGVIEERGDVVSLPGHEVTLTTEQEAVASKYLAALKAAPTSPPSPDQFEIGSELLAVLEDRGEITRIDENVVFAREHLDQLRDETLQVIDSDGQITLADFRDRFNTSRKYAQAVLEYFDQQNITRRVGDVRVRGRASG